MPTNKTHFLKESYLESVRQRREGKGVYQPWIYFVVMKCKKGLLVKIGETTNGIERVRCIEGYKSRRKFFINEGVPAIKSVLFWGFWDVRKCRKPNKNWPKGLGTWFPRHEGLALSVAEGLGMEKLFYCREWFWANDLSQCNQAIRTISSRLGCTFAGRFDTVSINSGMYKQ